MKGVGEGFFGSEFKAQRIIQVADDDVSPGSESDTQFMRFSSVKGPMLEIARLGGRKSCALE